MKKTNFFSAAAFAAIAFNFFACSTDDPDDGLSSSSDGLSSSSDGLSSSSDGLSSSSSAAIYSNITQLLNSTTRTIAYSSNLAFSDNDTIVDLVRNLREDRDFYAVAYKITLQAGNRIIINASKEGDGDSYLMLYKSGTLIDYDDDGGDNGSYLFFTAETAGDYFIVVTDFFSEVAGNYSLTVQVPPPPVTLAQLLNSTTKAISYRDDMYYSDNGTMVNAVNDPNFRENEGDYYAVAYKITLQAGKRIKINASRGEEGDSYLKLYKGGAGGYELIDENDDIGEGDNSSYLDFIVETAGDYYIVVTDYSPDVTGSYYLAVRAASPTSITLAQLLNNPTQTIAYNNNLAFTDNGTMVNAVNDPDFRDGESDYFAVAYKIALQAGERIEIHSSKEGDSWLDVYKVNGTVPEFIASDDDGYGSLESYLDFTAETAGEYYIVVTDVDPDIGGRYYLTVWNTNNEPGNNYPIVANAPKASKKSLKGVANSGSGKKQRAGK